MDSIRLKNLRSLADTGFIDIKPITLLLGQNSSGKSTFLRTFPLIRQSVESRTTGPILWYGQYVDFGNFQDALYSNAEEPEMTIDFHLKFSDLNSFRYRRPFEYRYFFYNTSKDDVFLGLTISSDLRKEGSVHKSTSLKFFGHMILINYDIDGKVTSLFVNGRDFSSFANEMYISPTGLVPHVSIQSNLDYEIKARITNLTDSKIFGLLQGEIKKHVHKKTGFETIRHIALILGVGETPNMLYAFQNTRNATDTWRDRVSTWTVNSEDFLLIRDLVIANAVPQILNMCDDYLSFFYKQSKYIAPVRATAERYYRIQNLAINEVDYQGQNLAMFLRNMSDSELKRFSEWTDKFFGISIHIPSSFGHISIGVKESGAQKGFNLADMGFGFSQMLPILVQLWLITQFKRYSRIKEKMPAITFAIEQPELHLHPRLQAKLADTFVDVMKFCSESNIDLRLVIETHSETIVNRIGLLIAKEKIPYQKVNVVLFEKTEPNEPTLIRCCNYSQDGFLTHWPIGFLSPEGIEEEN
jgi:predicted ATPase